MQLFALTSEKEVVAASHATKKQEYFCMECSKSVRLRGGLHRQDHFYHIKPDPQCRQSEKSMRHLHVQWYLRHLFSSGDVQLERRFPEISRIADVVWEDQKLVFEVQCSSITQKEVESRNRDYSSLGYQVVWILHDHRFITRKVSAAEEWLIERPHYYTNFDSDGNGEIFDQLHLFKRGLRCYSSERTAVNLLSPIIRGKNLIFEGDWKERKLSLDAAAIFVWDIFESEREKRAAQKKVNVWIEMKRWYLNLLNLVLEGCSTQDRGCQ